MNEVLNTIVYILLFVVIWNVSIIGFRVFFKIIMKRLNLYPKWKNYIDREYRYLVKNRNENIREQIMIRINKMESLPKVNKLIQSEKKKPVSMFKIMSTVGNYKKNDKYKSLVDEVFLLEKHYLEYPKFNMYGQIDIDQLDSFVEIMNVNRLEIYKGDCEDVLKKGLK